MTVTIAMGRKAERWLFFLGSILKQLLEKLNVKNICTKQLLLKICVLKHLTPTAKKTDLIAH